MSIVARAGLAAILLLASGLAAAPRAEEPGNFGAKPWLRAQPSERPTPLEQQRAFGYRSNLQRELRGLELRRPLANLRTIERLGTFRRELSRIERATGR